MLKMSQGEVCHERLSPRPGLWYYSSLSFSVSFWLSGTGFVLPCTHWQDLTLCPGPKAKRLIAFATWNVWTPNQLWFSLRWFSQVFATMTSFKCHEAPVLPVCLLKILGLHEAQRRWWWPCRLGEDTVPPVLSSFQVPTKPAYQRAYRTSKIKRQQKGNLHQAKASRM